MKAHWGFSVNPEETSDEAFTLPDDSTVQVPMFHGSQMAPVRVRDDLTAIDLGFYGTSELAVLILVPDHLSAFVTELDAERLAEILGGLEEAGVGLTIPRFEVRTHPEMIPALEALGMRQAFTGDADFSGMTGDRSLAIGAVEHETWVKANEEGIEAASATGIGFDVGGMEETAFVRLDRPFVFLIRDRRTGAILFMGQITDPSQVPA
jgi:serpin B